jgi:hypothetical protein
VPKSLLLFIISGAVFLLQYVTGGLLYFLAAPLWSIPLINLGFIGVMIESAFGIAARYWIVMPIIWFVGYACFTIWSHYQCQQIEREISSRNIGVRVPFSTASDDLVLNAHIPQAELTKVARILVKDYKIPVVFHNGAATRLATAEACDPSKLKDSNVLEFVSDPDMATRATWRCWISPQEPPHAPVTLIDVEASERTQARAGPVAIDRLSIVNADGTSVKVFYGLAEPLTWLPMPVLGFCYQGALGAGSVVNCSGFEREGGLPDPKDLRRAVGLASTIATAVGLERREP